jgi:hypothetical protein
VDVAAGLLAAAVMPPASAGTAAVVEVSGIG